MGTGVHSDSENIETFYRNLLLLKIIIIYFIYLYIKHSYGIYYILKIEVFIREICTYKN